MLQVIEKVNHFIQPILWGWPVLICILLAGILFTVRLRFFQFTKIGLWMKLTFAGMFRRKKQSNDGISPFQALTTALAGSIGTGNIVGVATALTLGMARRNLLDVDFSPIGNDDHICGNSTWYEISKKR